MRLSLIFALLYAALSVSANPVTAGELTEAERSVLLDTRVSDMRKMQLHSEARPAVSGGFETETGQPKTFAEYEGKFLLVNFWATWCAPCREEMPSLAALNTDWAGADFEVVAIATGRNRLEGIHDFYAENAIEGLEIFLDPRGQLARDMGVVGLPVTVVIAPDGTEIARLVGGADWHAQSTKDWIQALMAAW